jgi:T5orf172 domain
MITRANRRGRLSGSEYILSEQNRIWLKAFWGFNPEQAGYLGFTHEGVRNKLIESYQPGDLILIYGADSPETERRLRGQALGLLEIDPQKAVDRDLMSPQAIADKVSRGWGDRWTFAVPVLRAWRVGRKISIQNAAPNTDWRRRGRVIASQAELMAESDAAAIFSWPVKEVPVWGNSIGAIADSAPEQTLQKSWLPSIGPKPTFGERVSNYEDGETVVYVLEFLGDLGAFLGMKPFELSGQRLIKIGRSNAMARRVDEINFGFPQSAKMRWKERVRSRPFPSAQLADDAEKSAHKVFAEIGRSQGGEFFLCSEKFINSTFSKLVEGSAFRINAPSKRSD